PASPRPSGPTSRPARCWSPTPTSRGSCRSSACRSGRPSPSCPDRCRPPRRRRAGDPSSCWNTGPMTLALPGWTHTYSGKVRDLYLPVAGSPAAAHGDVVLVVASDRISAYDHVLSTPVPGKGTVLTQLSLWWFD